MEIHLKTPDAIIMSQYDGNRDIAYQFKDIGIEVKDAWLGWEASETCLGAKVLVPYGNIAYIILDNGEEEYEDDNVS